MKQGRLARLDVDTSPMDTSRPILDVKHLAPNDPEHQPPAADITSPWLSSSVAGKSSAGNLEAALLAAAALSKKPPPLPPLKLDLVSFFNERRNELQPLFKAVAQSHKAQEAGKGGVDHARAMQKAAADSLDKHHHLETIVPVRGLGPLMDRWFSSSEGSKLETLRLKKGTEGSTSPKGPKGQKGGPDASGGGGQQGEESPTSTNSRALAAKLEKLGMSGDVPRFMMSKGGPSSRGGSPGRGSSPAKGGGLTKGGSCSVSRTESPMKSRSQAVGMDISKKFTIPPSAMAGVNFDLLPDCLVDVDAFIDDEPSTLSQLEEGIGLENKEEEFVPKDSVLCGVSLAFLQSLAKFLQGMVLYTSFVTEAPITNQTSTAEVVARFIRPHTEDKKCRFCDLLPYNAVARPRAVVSHWWESGFLGLVQSLCDHYSREDPHRVHLWIDIFACKQDGNMNTGEDHSELFDTCSRIKKIIKTTDKTLLVLDADGLIFRRGWVLYEMWCANQKSQFSSGNKLVPLVNGLRWTPMMYEVYKNMDILHAKTSFSMDKHLITREVEKAGGLVAFNRNIKSAMLQCCQAELGNLEPMSDIHPAAYIKCSLQLAFVQRLEGMVFEAESQLRHSLHFLLNGLHGEARDVEHIVVELADLLSAEGRPPQDGLNFCRAAIERFERQFGTDHRGSVNLTALLGELLLRSGSLQPAYQSLQAALLRQSRVHANAPHRSGADTMYQMGVLLQQQGKLADAEHYLAGALSVYNTLLGQRHPASAFCLWGLGENCQKQEEHGNAAVWLMQARMVLDLVYHKRSHQWVRTTIQLATSIQKLGHLPTAEVLYRRLMHQAVLEERGNPPTLSFAYETKVGVASSMEERGLPRTLSFSNATKVGVASSMETSPTPGRASTTSGGGPDSRQSSHGQLALAAPRESPGGSSETPARASTTSGGGSDSRQTSHGQLALAVPRELPHGAGEKPARASMESMGGDETVVLHMKETMLSGHIYWVASGLANVLLEQVPVTPLCTEKSVPASGYLARSSHATPRTTQSESGRTGSQPGPEGSGFPSLLSKAPRTPSQGGEAGPPPDPSGGYAAQGGEGGGSSSPAKGLKGGLGSGPTMAGKVGKFKLGVEPSTTVTALQQVMSKHKLSDVAPSLSLDDAIFQIHEVESDGTQRLVNQPSFARTSRNARCIMTSNKLGGEGRAGLASKESTPRVAPSTPATTLSEEFTDMTPYTATTQEGSEGAPGGAQVKFPLEEDPKTPTRPAEVLLGEVHRIVHQLLPLYDLEVARMTEKKRIAESQPKTRSLDQSAAIVEAINRRHAMLKKQHSISRQARSGGSSPTNAAKLSPLPNARSSLTISAPGGAKDKKKGPRDMRRSLEPPGGAKPKKRTALPPMPGNITRLPPITKTPLPSETSPARAEEGGGAGGGWDEEEEDEEGEMAFKKDALDEDEEVMIEDADPQTLLAEMMAENPMHARLMEITTLAHNRFESLRERHDYSGAKLALTIIKDIVSHILGPSDPVAIVALADLLDLMVTQSNYVEAQDIFEIHTKPSSKLNMRSRSKLRAKVQGYMTFHAFTAVRNNDELLCESALNLGAKTQLKLERLLVLSAAMGHVSVCSTIVRVRPAALEDQDCATGRCPLAYASYLGNTHVVELLLLAKQTKTDAVDYAGMTALSLAATAGQLRIVQLLLVSRASINARDNRLRTPLILASMEGHEKVIEALIENEVATDMQDEEGKSALMHACRGCHVSCVKTLLAGGADPDQQDSTGLTALAHTCVRGFDELIPILLSQKADVQLPDTKGRVALMHASKGGHPRVIDQLLALHNCGLGFRDEDGRTPLMFAAEGGFIGIIYAMLLACLVGKAIRVEDNMEMAKGSEVRSVIKIKVDKALAAAGAIAETVRKGMSQSVMSSEESTALVISEIMQVVGGNKLGGNATIDRETAIQALRIMAACSLPQIRSYVGAKDKMGLTASMHAIENGHMELGTTLEQLMV